MSLPGIYGNRHRYLVRTVLSEQHLVVGDIPGLDADHATPHRVAEIGQGGCFLDPGIPNDGRGGAVLLDDDTVPPPTIFDAASPWRIEVRRGRSPR